MIEIEDLKRKANNIRIGVIEAVYNGKSGHPGGSLSSVEIMTALYFTQMRVDPNNPKDENRDRFILSKGHASPVLYATLAEKGFFPKEELSSFRKMGSNLQGHPVLEKVPGVDMTSGSLGQGMSISNGMALSGRLANKDYRVYCLLGDGELQEGQVWEAAMTSGHYKLDHLCVLVDNNDLQIDGNVRNVMNVHPIGKKFESFGFHVIHVDGHNLEEIIHALEEAKKAEGKPTAIIAKTTKGKGVSFMENKAEWHGVAPKEEEYQTAMEELKRNGG